MGVEPIFPAWKADELTDIRTEHGDNSVLRLQQLSFNLFKIVSD